MASPFARKKSSLKAGRENWVRDSTVSQCHECHKNFDLLTRKHHCRACGNIFCGKCSNKRIRYTAYTRKNEASYTEKKKRVCRNCYQNIVEARKKAAEVKERASTVTGGTRSQASRGGAGLGSPELDQDPEEEIEEEEEEEGDSDSEADSVDWDYDHRCAQREAAELQRLLEQQEEEERKLLTVKAN